MNTFTSTDINLEMINHLIRRVNELESELTLMKSDQLVMQEMIDDLTLKVNALDYCVDTNSYYE